MNTALKFLVELLYNRVTCNGTNVPIIKRPYPVDQTPCLTIDVENNTLDGYYYTYDPYEHLNREYDTTVAINIWANKEQERVSICESLEKLLLSLILNHAKLCTEYQDGVCLITSTPCNPDNKHQCNCFHGKQYYNSLFTKHQIDPTTFGFDDGVDADEYERHLLRTRIRVQFKYTRSMCNDGRITDKIYNGV